MRPITLIITLILLANIATVSRSYAKTPRDVLNQMGFMQVASEPIDFSLDAIGTNSKSLSDYKGKWIWLAFWATWCGPCQYEMPTLEKIHQEYKDKNLAILGVSIDTGVARGVRKFLKQKGISFPSFLDPNNEVSAKYQASSVPSIYVISPDWKLVGIFRGAKSWETPEMMASIRELISFKKFGDVPVVPLAKGIGAAKQIELPNNLVPPQIAVQIPTGQLETGEMFELTISVEWKGEASQYVIKTPRITVPAGVVIGSVSSTTSTDMKGATLLYKYPVTILKDGEYKLGPFELSFRPRAGGKELFSRAPEVLVKVVTSIWKKWLWPTIAIIIFISLAGLIVVTRVWKKRENSIGFETQTSIDESDFANLKKLKISGDRKEYMQSLLEFSKKLDENSENEKIANLIEGIRFAGKELTPAEISYYENRIEKYFEKNNSEEE